MKLSVLFLICSLSMTYAAESYAQKTMISLEVRNETVGTVLEKLKKESGFDFFFNNKHVDLKRIVSVSANNNNIFKILDQIFAGTNVKYSVLEKKIILSTEIVQGIQQEQNKVTGIVKDANGEPIIGANVIVKGQSTGTITDIDGRFVLDTPKDAVLQITYIGYVSQEVKVSGKKELNVVLKEDTETLEEVVVVGYGVQKKANLTGAVSSVKMDEILGDRPVTSVSNVLMGAMPGLQVTGTSGQPGAEMSFNIRGVNSINEGAPLVLVDNVEMDINMLDPNDIESISVLKDAASSAIYGARAAFGVILVTTKKGMKDTRFSINYSNNFSFSKPSNLPHKATPLQTVQAYKDMGTVSYQTGQNVDTWLELLKEYNTNSSNYPDGYAVVDGLRYSLQETDLLNDMMETGFQQTHNISVGGGNKSISYRMSAGMVNQNGILVTDKDSYKRYNISSYIRSDIHSWITPELDIKYANSHSELPYTSASYGIWGAAVAFPSYFPLGNMELDGEILPINTPHNFINLSAPKENDRNDLRIFGKLTITPFKDLKIIGEYTFNRKTREITTFDKKFAYAHGANFRKEQSVSNSKYEIENRATNYNAFNVYANYNKTLGKHDIGIMAGFNQESNSYKMMKASRTDMINEDLPSLSQATGDYKNSDEFEEYHVRGLFYRINYSYAGKYLLETNGRYDGSSKFPKENRFGFFPSISAAWIISQEKFMHATQNWLNYAKLRISYGALGNQDVSYYEYIASMGSSEQQLLINGIKPMGVTPSGLVSNSLTWEKVYTKNIGLDLNFFNNRLTFSGDIYRRDTKDMLTKGKTLPSVLGALEPRINAADMKTEGWEISLGWRDLFNLGNKPFSYNVKFVLSDNRSFITRFDNPTGNLDDWYEGCEIGEIWGLVTEGFFKDQADIDNHADQWDVTSYPGDRPIEPGDLKYKDLDNNGKINNGSWTVNDPGDYKVIGNNASRYNYGADFTAEWNGLDFRVLLQGVGKKDWYPESHYFFGIYRAPWGNVLENNLDHWTPENTDAYFPRLKSYIAEGGKDLAINQTRYLQNAAYLRIKNITIGYTLPKKFTMKAKLERVRLYLTGDNIFEFTKLSKNYDPEILGTSHPMQRLFTFGLNLSF